MARNYDALLRFIERHAHTRFRWARRSNNCVSYAGRAAKAQTGRDPLGDLNWSNLREAKRLLARLGGLEAATDGRLPRVAPAMAQRGDIAGVADERFGLRLMVVEGATLVGPGADGNERVPRSEMIAAWSVEPGPGTADV
jgi:hypothetical protein